MRSGISYMYISCIDRKTDTNQHANINILFNVHAYIKHIHTISITVHFNNEEFKTIYGKNGFQREYNEITTNMKLALYCNRTKIVNLFVMVIAE